MAGEGLWDTGLDCEEARGGRAAAGLWTLSLWESLSDVGLVLTPSEWPWAADWDGLLRFRVGLTRYCRGMGPVCTETHISLGLWKGAQVLQFINMWEHLQTGLSVYTDYSFLSENYIFVQK